MANHQQYNTTIRKNQSFSSSQTTNSSKPSTHPSSSNSNSKHEWKADDEDTYFRRRHLDDVGQILALKVTQSNKVTLAAPFDQLVPGCYSISEAVIPTNVTSHKLDMLPQIIKKRLRSVNGTVREGGLKQDQGYIGGSSSIMLALKSANDQDDPGTPPLPKYVSCHDATATNNVNSYTAEASALVHLSRDDFIAEFFKFGEGSKMLTSCTLLDQDKSEENHEFNAVVSFPNNIFIRYSLLNNYTLYSNLSLKEGDSVIAYYSVTDIATIARPQETKARGFFIISPRPHECCQVTLTAEISTTSALNITKIIKSAIMLIRTAYDAFYRGEEVDDAVALAFISSMSSAPPLTPQESRCLNATTQIMNEGTFKRVWTGETSIDAYEVFTNKESRLGRVNKCRATIHLSAERLLALRFAYNSYADMSKNKVKNKDLPRYGCDVPNSHSRLIGGSIYFRGVHNRRVNQIYIWDKIENYQNLGNPAYILAVLPQTEFTLPTESEPNIPPLTKGLIQGTTRVFMSFEELSPKISRVTLIQWTDFGGSISIPVHLSDLAKAYALNYVKALQKRFSRKKSVVDVERRDHFAAKLKAVLPNALNEEQLRIVTTAQALEQEYADSPVVRTRLRSTSYFTPMQVKFVAPRNGERAVGTGQTSSIFDVSAEVAIAQISRNASREGFPTSFQVEDRGLFDGTYVYVRKAPRPRREFLFRVITHKHALAVAVDDATSSDSDSPSSYLSSELLSSYSVSVVSVPDQIADYGIAIKTVRAHTVAIYTVTPIPSRTGTGTHNDDQNHNYNQNQCNVVMTQKIDAGGFVPNFTFNFGVREVGNLLATLSFLRLASHRDAEIDRLERRLVTDAMAKEAKEVYDKVNVTIGGTCSESEYDRDRRGNDRDRGGNNNSDRHDDDDTTTTISRKFPITSEEDKADKALISRVTDRFAQLVETGVKTTVLVVKNLTSDALVDTSSYLARDGSITLHSAFIVDACVEEVAAFLFCLKSRFLSEAHYKAGESIEIEKVNEHKQTVYMSMKNSPKNREIANSNPLEFECTMVWKRGDGDGDGDGDYYDVVVEPFTDRMSSQRSSQSQSISGGKALSIYKSRNSRIEGRMLSFKLPLPQRQRQIKASQVVPLARVGSAGSAGSKREKRSARVAESKLWSYTRLERMVGEGEGERKGSGVEGKHYIPQTRVKFYTQLRLGESFNLDNANAFARKQHIASAIRLRKYFDRSTDSDQVARNRFIAAISGVNGAGVYTVEEDALITRGIKRLDDLEINIKMKKVKQLGSPLSVNRIGNTKGSNAIFGSCNTTIRAETKEVLAFLWNFDSRHNARRDTINKHVVEEANGHNKVGYMEFATYKVFNNRDLLFRMLWKKLDITSSNPSVNDKDTYILVIGSVDPTYPFPITRTSGRGNAPIRAMYTATVRLTQTSERETKVEHLLLVSLGEALDKSILTSITLKLNLKRTVAMQQYFQELVKLGEMDEKDGVEIGETLILCRSKVSVKLSAAKVFARHVALVELNEQYDFFEPMMTYITAIDLSISDLSSSSKGIFNKRTKLEVLSKYDGKKLARFLRQMILSSANQGVAVQRFQESVAMNEFLKTHPFIRSMIRTMCLNIITERTLDKFFQSGKKVVSSLADVASDITIAIVYFREDGRRTTAYALIAIIVASLFMQLGLCVINHYRNWRVMLREMLFTLGFVRGGVLHMRVLTKQQPDGHETYFDAIMESLAYRGLEIIFESIPGAFIQLSAILTDPDSISEIKYLSLAISIGIVSVSVSNMDYSKDSDFKNRSQLHQFYGFIPGQGFRKFAVVFFMRVICLTQFCIRIGFLSLMGNKSISLSLILLSGEFAVYMAIKIGRDDVRYWFPVSQFPSVVFSLILRFLVFEIAAATSMLQSRHPYELGGVGYIFCQLLTHTELLYISFVHDFPSVTWTSTDIRTISIITVVTWWVAFGLMLMFGEAKYRHTFFSTHNSARYLKFVFESGGDGTKARFITNHRSYWEWFLPDIEEWLNENWERWEHESATKDDNPFFNDKWKRTIKSLNLTPDWVDKVSDGNDAVVSIKRNSMALV